MTLKVFFGHGNRTIVVNDELAVGRQSNVKFYAVKHRKRMTEAFEGVFGRWFPWRPLVHVQSSPRSPSKVTPAVGECC